MTVSLEKNSYRTGQVDWNYLIFEKDVLAGTCLIEVMNGQDEDVLKRYDAEEAHNCFDILSRIHVIDSSKLRHKMAFIRMIEIDEAYQRRGIGRKALRLILDELHKNGYEWVILDAFKGGFLIPFYASFGFEKIPFPKTVSVEKQTADNGGNFMWKNLH